ncbi:MAG: trk system potassium uptake protein TrkH [Planctomycetota bacterium]|jgi:trk system potassium uptake protein TrkH
MNLRAVGRLLGVVILLMACFLLIPACVAIGFKNYGTAIDFLISATITGVLAGALAYLCRRKSPAVVGAPDYFRREGLAVVGLSWLVGGLSGALPYLVHGTFGPFSLASCVDSYFEAVSGLTTTGSTVMSAAQIDGMDPAIAFWRSFSHWLGGFGIVMVFVVLFPTGGRSLFRSEVPGVAREAGHSRVRDSALTLMRIYVGFTVLELIMLLAAGMNGFDALLHTLGTIPTGGFSNHSSSIAHFDSVSIEVIITLFMFLCGFNFGLYETLIRVGPRPFLRRLWGSSEARWYAGIALFASLFVASVLWFDGGTNGGPPPGQEAGWKDYSNFWTCLRDSSFLTVSMQTSTGYGSANYDLWPQIARVMMMFLAVSGACAGSTGGGIKMVRILVIAKAAINGVRRFSRPRAIHAVRIDGQTLDDGVVASITGYFALWVLVFMGGTLFLSCFSIGGKPVDLVTAGTAVLATLNNIGPGLAKVGPFMNFAELPALAKLVLTGFMILGRLEFYAMVALFVPSFWRR